MTKDPSGVTGRVEWELTGPDGKVKQRGVSFNIVTNVGDSMYADRGAGVASPPASPTGMKLGDMVTPTTPAKSGTASTLESYLTGSDHAFDATPTSSTVSNKREVTYVCTYAATEATTGANPISEAVIVNDTLTDSAPVEAETIARVLISPTITKASTDTLTVTWKHTVGS